MEVSELKRRLQALDLTIQKLAIHLRNHPQSHAAVTQRISFPEYSENALVLPVAGAVVRGEAALNSAIGIFSDYYRIHGQPPLSASRTVGVVFGGMDALDLVQSINQQKDDLKAVLSALPQRDRAVLIREAAQGLVLIELYRHIHTAVDPEQVSPSWVVSGVSKKVTDFHAVLEGLKVHLSALNKRPDLNSAEIDLAQQKISDIEAVLEHNSAAGPTTQKRHTKPHIKYNIRFPTGEWMHHPAGMPVIVIIEKSGTFSYKELGQLSDIRSFDRNGYARVLLGTLNGISSDEK